MVDLRDVHEIKQKSNLSDTGTIYSYTVVHETPEGYEDNTPYVLALVKLDDGPIVTAQITDVQGDLSIGSLLRWSHVNSPLKAKKV
jgi:uncharacterized OB-fold protein